MGSRAVSGAELMFEDLPPSAYIKDFVNGINYCNYEIYLRELLNSSSHFLRKGGSNYAAPISEESGQYDAISNAYMIDFKLLSSQTKLMADSTLREQPRQCCNGLVVDTVCKRPGGSITASWIHVLLRGLSVEELERLSLGCTSYTNTDSDIPRVTKVAAVKKHILLFFPFKFSFSNAISFSDAIYEIRRELSNDFKNLFIFREKVATGFDTYFTTVYSDLFLLFCVDRGELCFIESVSSRSMPTYLKLLDFDDRRF